MLRLVAVPFLGKVRQLVERMERLGVITKVEALTEWCAGIAVVQKPNSSVHVCVDITKLNQSVCLERHCLPCLYGGELCLCCSGLGKDISMLK